MARVNFTVLVTEEDDGSRWAEVKELPGCFASGFSLDELKEATFEAIQLCLPEGIKLEQLEWKPVKERAPKSGADKRRAKTQQKMLVCG